MCVHGLEGWRREEVREMERVVAREMVEEEGCQFERRVDSGPMRSASQERAISATVARRRTHLEVKPRMQSIW